MGIFDIFDTNDQQAAAQAQISGINAGLTGLEGDYGQAATSLNTNYMAGMQPFMQNFNTATQGLTAYGNALGVNGPQGSQQATQAFQNNPGYAFQQQQGDNAITAQNAASGKTGSGNEAVALSNYNQGLAGTSWNNYVQNLSPYMSLANSSASGVGTLYGQLGTNLSNLYQGEGNAVYGADTSIGNANANADLAGLNASANSINAIMGLGGMAVGALSDERAKEDIEPIGELPDGLTVYRYRYRGDPRTQIGLIAQEVEAVNPDAVIDNFLGDLKGVDYRKATDFAATLMRFADAPTNDNIDTHADQPEALEDEQPASYGSTLLRMAA